MSPRDVVVLASPPGGRTRWLAAVAFLLLGGACQPDTGVWIAPTDGGADAAADTDAGTDADTATDADTGADTGPGCPPTGAAPCDSAGATRCSPGDETTAGSVQTCT